MEKLPRHIMQSCIWARVHWKLFAAGTVERPDHVRGENQLSMDMSTTTHEIINLHVSGTPPNGDLLDEALTLFRDAQQPGIRKSWLVLLGSLIVQNHVTQLELGQYRLEDLVSRCAGI